MVADKTINSKRIFFIIKENSFIKGLPSLRNFRQIPSQIADNLILLVLILISTTFNN